MTRTDYGPLLREIRRMQARHELNERIRLVVLAVLVGVAAGKWFFTEVMR